MTPEDVGSTVECRFARTEAGEIRTEDRRWAFAYRARLSALQSAATAPLPIVASARPSGHAPRQPRDVHSAITDQPGTGKPEQMIA